MLGVKSGPFSRFGDKIGKGDKFTCILRPTLGDQIDERDVGTDEDINAVFFFIFELPSKSLSDEK